MKTEFCVFNKYWDQVGSCIGVGDKIEVTLNEYDEAIIEFKNSVNSPLSSYNMETGEAIHY